MTLEGYEQILLEFYEFLQDNAISIMKFKVFWFLSVLYLCYNFSDYD